MGGKLNMIVKERRDQDTHIEKLKAGIRAKGAPLKVSQSRLEKRSHRPEIENCNDAPHIKMVEEVSAIHQSIDHLSNKLTEAQEAKQELVTIQQQLEQDIRVKGNSLRIDKQKCLGMRST